MDLSTTYLGFHLSHPFVPGPGPLADDLDKVRRLEDAGAPMIILRSLFEEQIKSEELATLEATETHTHAFAEAVDFLPTPAEFVLGPHEYLEHLAAVKKAVRVPVLASLNGTTRGGWLDYATQIEQAGADALELNVYDLPTDPQRGSQSIEDETVEMVYALRRRIRLPIAVKLSPFYSSIAHMARRLIAAGANGLVIFNRFYQPDIDVEDLAVIPSLHLSNSHELLLRLRWAAILSAAVDDADLAVTGGVHNGIDAVKALMCGATVVQMVSSLLQRGFDYLDAVRLQVSRWMQDHQYSSVREMRGCMNLSRCPDPGAYERANYMRVLQSWQ